MNIATLLEMAADAFPDRIALTSGGIHYDYSKLLTAARRVAADIRKKQVSHVGYLALSSPVAPVALFGAAIAGLPYVPFNYRLTADELTALITRVAPAILIADADYATRVAVPPGVEVWDCAGYLRSVLENDTTVDAVDAVMDERAVAVQLFTSGTTGQPKAALLRHENLFSYIVGSVEFAGADPDEATLVAVPPYHIAGISALLSSIYAGRRIVQLANFDAAEWLRLCRDERVTNAFLVPTMLSRLVDHLHKAGEAANLPALRAIAYGGGRMPLPVIEKAIEMFPGVDFTNAYGLTETSSTIALLDPESHRAAISSSDPLIRRRLGSVGRGLPSVEIEIRDDAGRPVATETVGRVHVRGPQVSGEYGHANLRDPEGWFDTRDRGYQDGDGFLFLDGRADDVIVRGGENISPGEIEEALLAHPDIAEVAVVGVPDEDWGEVVAAAVVSRNPQIDKAALRAWVQERLRSSRVPAHIRLVEALPYNELGKLLRRVVRDEFATADKKV